MQLIDTHAHLYAAKFDKDREEMIERALARGINRLYLPNIDSQSIEGMLKLEAQYPAHCFAMMGLHPCSVKENYKEELVIVKKWLDERDFCAVGEIGIDLYWDKTFLAAQKDAFRTQIAWAKELDRPIVIHARESLDIILEIVEEEKDARLRGIFHCFSGDIKQAERVIELGFYMGLGGVLTYKKSTLPEVVEQVDLDYFVLETDAPYLPPVPYRGKRNESSYVYHVAEKLAEVKGLSLEEVARVTTKNAEQIFAK